MIACPPEREPDPAVRETALALCARGGGSVEVVQDPKVAVAGAHAVYTDVWVSMAPKPRNRGFEVTDEVIDGPSSAVWQQAGNRLHTEQAVFHTLIRSAGRFLQGTMR